jgi:HSP20 family protein
MEVRELEGSKIMSRALSPWSHWTPVLFEDLGKEMNRLLSHLGDAENGESRSFAPRIDIAETDKSYEVSLDLPGMKSDDFNIEFKDGQLWISGERKQQAEEKGKTFHRVERYHGQFRRVITLGTDVDAEKVEATYRDGVLKLHVPKVASVQPRRINVKS